MAVASIKRWYDEDGNLISGVFPGLDGPWDFPHPSEVEWARERRAEVAQQKAVAAAVANQQSDDGIEVTSLRKLGTHHE